MVSQSDLTRLVGALIGVAAGALLALVLACAAFPTHGSAAITPNKVGALAWAVQGWGSRDFHEDREKIFYLATLIFGGSSGLLCAWLRVAGNRLKILPLLLLIGFVPVMNEIIRRCMDRDVLYTAMCAAFGLLVLACIAVLSKYGPDLAGVSYRSKDRRSMELPSAAGSKGSVQTRIAVLETLIAIALIAEFLIPTNMAAVARSIGYEMHLGFYMIGPATYEFAKALIPGVDYYTQYSVGTPWLFHYFLDPSITQTMINAVWFEVAEIAFFEISLFFFLRWLLQSWGWAIVLTIAILLTQFLTPDPLYAPSSTASRYPLLAVVGICLGIWVNRELRVAASLPLTLALAASLFLNTETGVDGSVAVAAAAVATSSSLMRSVSRVALLSVFTLIGFMLFSAVAFGRGVFDFHFLQYLLEPMLLYGSGLTSSPIRWETGWSWVYNIVAPGFALATAVWVVAVARTQTRKLPSDRLAALAWMSLLGLFMSAKFVNMSVLTVWQPNSWPFLIVLSWWAKTAIEVVRDRRLVMRPFALNLRHALTAGAAAVLILFLIGLNDGSSMLYAIPSYRTLPSVVNRAFGVRSEPCMDVRTGCSSVPVARKDVDLIRSLTRPDERVAVYGLQDWVYLVEAQRASKFAELPSKMIFTQRQIDESVRDIDLIFVPRRPAATFGIDTTDGVASILIPQLQTQFKLIAEGFDLLAFKRTH